MKNKYTLEIYWKSMNSDFYFTVYTNETKEYVKNIIRDNMKEHKFNSPVELMDYVCASYNMIWEDIEADIDIIL